MAQHSQHREDFQTHGFSRINLSPAEIKLFRAGVKAARDLHAADNGERARLGLGTVFGMRGYTGYELQPTKHLSAAEKERRYYSFEYGHEDQNQSDELSEFLRAANIWPDQNDLHKNICIEMQALMKDVAVDVILQVARQSEAKIREMFAFPSGNTRLLRYSGATDDNIPYHHDYEFVTLIYSTSPSLLVKHAGETIRANESEESLIVLPGDALARLSGGEIKATVHGAAPRSERFSIVYFLCSGANVWLSAKGDICHHGSAGAAFSPAEHLAGMHLANNAVLRKICRSPYLQSLIPAGKSNPFLASGIDD
ncbi:2OG-Fe(II) oxygenase family protein [Roseovarius ramblicola]|uniref:2-oxoglutarate-dependent ethylene/succinate-forming enzyme n=1 Tax=Roseovarius ramblicola TaxID=2022336 RepID=A0ABV5HZT9_9RHOB